jgi:hypothetical protein
VGEALELARCRGGVGLEELLELAELVLVGVVDLHGEVGHVVFHEGFFAHGASAEGERGLGGFFDEDEFGGCLGPIIVDPEVDVLGDDLRIFGRQGKFLCGEPVLQGVGAGDGEPFRRSRSGALLCVLGVDLLSLSGCHCSRRSGFRIDGVRRGGTDVLRLHRYHRSV